MSIAYDRKTPYFAEIKERFLLNKKKTKKNTFHIVLNLKDSKISYEPGDSIGILPRNDPEVIDKTLQAMGSSGLELVIDPKTSTSIRFRDWLEVKANLTTITKKLVSTLCEKQTNLGKKEKLQALLKEENLSLWKEFCEIYHLQDLLIEHQEVKFTAQEYCDLISPLLPRFYSVASSMKAVGEEVHLTVAMLEYYTKD